MLFGGSFFLVLMIFYWIRTFPIVRKKESFRSEFPREKFQLKEHLPLWMKEQIESDLSPFEQIRESSFEKTYENILQKLGKKAPFYRYRIVHNRLYKFCQEEPHFSDTDTVLEKAIKTLLIYAKVPDVEFILCAMDGMVESYLPQDFYLLADEKEQAPILAQAKIKEPGTKKIVLIPDQFSLHPNWKKTVAEVLQINEEIPWERKKDLAYWRGGLTDAGVPDDQIVAHFAACPRFILCQHSKIWPDLIDAGLNWANQKMKPIFEKENVMKNTANKKDHLQFRYLPVLDGHMCTYPGFQWRLLSNSLCLKQESMQMQWFYPALQPFIHFIPIEEKMSDLKEKLFWAQSNQEIAHQISIRAQHFVLNNLLLEDNYFYLKNLLIALAAKEKIDFSRTKKDQKWKCIQYRKKLKFQKWMKKKFSLLLPRNYA